MKQALGVVKGAAQNLDPTGILGTAIDLCQAIIELRGQLKANKEQSNLLIEKVVLLKETLGFLAKKKDLSIQLLNHIDSLNKKLNNINKFLERYCNQNKWYKHILHINSDTSSFEEFHKEVSHWVAQLNFSVSADIHHELKDILFRIQQTQSDVKIIAKEADLRAIQANQDSVLKLQEISQFYPKELVQRTINELLLNQGLYSAEEHLHGTFIENQHLRDSICMLQRKLAERNPGGPLIFSPVFLPVCATLLIVNLTSESCEQAPVCNGKLTSSGLNNFFRKNHELKYKSVHHEIVYHGATQAEKQENQIGNVKTTDGKLLMIFEEKKVKFLSSNNEKLRSLTMLALQAFSEKEMPLTITFDNYKEDVLISILDEIIKRNESIEVKEKLFLNLNLSEKQLESIKSRDSRNFIEYKIKKSNDIVRELQITENTREKFKYDQEHVPAVLQPAAQNMLLARR